MLRDENTLLHKTLDEQRADGAGARREADGRVASAAAEAAALKAELQGLKAHVEVGAAEHARELEHLRRLHERDEASAREWLAALQVHLPTRTHRSTGPERRCQRPRPAPQARCPSREC